MIALVWPAYKASNLIIIVHSSAQLAYILDDKVYKSPLQTLVCPTNVPGVLRELPNHFPFIWLRSTEKAEAFLPPLVIVLDLRCDLVWGNIRGDNRGDIFSVALVNWLKFSIYRGGDILKCLNRTQSRAQSGVHLELPLNFVQDIRLDLFDIVWNSEKFSIFAEEKRPVQHEVLSSYLRGL